jgi:hypothetical protein
MAGWLDGWMDRWLTGWLDDLMIRDVIEMIEYMNGRNRTQ